MALLLDPIVAAIRRFFSPIAKLWDKIVAAYEHLKNIGASVTHLVETIKNEVEAWKNFRQNPRWRSRVINAPIAFEKTSELIGGIPAAWRAIADLFKELKNKVDAAGDPEAEAKDFAKEIEGGEGISGLLRRFPRIIKSAEKLFGALAIVVDALESISNAIDDIQTIVDEAARIRSEIEELDTIFLSQKNKRKKVETTDGEKLLLRVGNLHS